MVMDKSLGFSTNVILQSIFWVFLKDDLCFVFIYLLFKKKKNIFM